MVGGSVPISPRQQNQNQQENPADDHRTIFSCKTDAVISEVEPGPVVC